MNLRINPTQKFDRQPNFGCKAVIKAVGYKTEEIATDSIGYLADACAKRNNLNEIMTARQDAEICKMPSAYKKLLEIAALQRLVY